VSASLLDTSILIAPGGSDLGDLPPAAAISIISLGELRAGVLLAHDELTRANRVRRLDAVRSAFSPLVVDEPVAERYGEILALARRQGMTEKATDLLIVATALATGRILFTRDERQAKLAEAAGSPVTTV
jgi:predicted nucleic acid-binding protein